MRELADIVVQLTGSSSKITYKKLPSDDPKQRQPDISVANNLLKWFPKVSIYDGLKRTILYLDQLLKNA
jgi:UDP-glucuronate decarboxylase